jgi:general secretion pathway protein D
LQFITLGEREIHSVNGVSRTQSHMSGAAGSFPVSIFRAGALAFVRRLLVCWFCLIVAACGNNLGSSSLENPRDVDLSAKKPGKSISRRESSSPPSNGRGSYQLFPGSPQDMADSSQDAPPGVAESDGKFTINVDRADINEVAKLVLGETLGFSYVVDPRVQGTITLASSRALSSREVLDAFEAALRLNGAALVQTDGVAKIVALQEVLDGEMGSPDLGSGSTSAGYGVSAIPLRYISVANMMELMDSFIARGGSVRASNIGNLILVRGTAAERRSLVDVVLSFDVDWMRSQTASIAILANSSPEEMVSKLEAVFAQDTATSGNNAIKVVPLERLNGVIIVGNSQQKVRRALAWVGRLDKASATEDNYYVYAVQNGSAADLAKILTSTFIDKSDAAGLTADVAPDQATVQQSTGQPSPGDQQGIQQDGTQQGAEPGKSDRQDGTPALPSDGATASAAQPELAPGIRITPNIANNTIVIRANERQYRKILATLRQIDAPGVQVLINTTIAEVLLNDTLRYGVQAYFKDDKVSGGIFGGTGLKLRPSFPGLNFLLGSTNDPRLVIDALSAVTTVRIVSSPSIAVLENETATIKVGDQVPIKTGGTAGTVGVAATETFEYRDTGVILKVKPRVNSAGLVTMEIGQELSSVVAGSAGAPGKNPTFSQRTISSKVSVYSTQTVVLGGLISGQESRQRDSVPGVNKIPILGDLFGKTENSGRRNELIVFITPQIIQDGEDASRVSEELRAKMRLFNVN